MQIKGIFHFSGSEYMYIYIKCRRESNQAILMALLILLSHVANAMARTGLIPRVYSLLNHAIMSPLLTVSFPAACQSLDCNIIECASVDECSTNFEPIIAPLMQTNTNSLWSMWWWHSLSARMLNIDWHDKEQTSPLASITGPLKCVALCTIWIHSRMHLQATLVCAHGTTILSNYELFVLMAESIFLPYRYKGLGLL